MKKILNLTDTEALDPSIAGSKGANLARLQKQGLNVPPAIIVSDSGCRDMDAATRAHILSFIAHSQAQSFAIRPSSYGTNDGQGHYLDVTAPHILEKITECHLSYLSNAAGGAVIVQEMILPHIFGTAFSGGAGDTSIAVIEYTEGNEKKSATVNKTSGDISPLPDNAHTAEMLTELAKISAQCVQEWTTPVDIEFAMMKNGTIYILQCRPTTAA